MIHKKPSETQTTTEIDFSALDFFGNSSKENERKIQKNGRKRKKSIEEVPIVESVAVEETDTQLNNEIKKKKKKKKKKTILLELEGLFV